MKRFITEEDIKKAIQMKADGYTWLIIGKRLKVSQTGICNAVNRWEKQNGTAVR